MAFDDDEYTDATRWTAWTPYEVVKPKPKCECGVTIALGKEDDPIYHSDWCPIKKEYDKQQKEKTP